MESSYLVTVTKKTQFHQSYIQWKMHPGRNFNKEKVKHNETTSINDSPRLLLILFIWIIKATLPYMSSIEVPTYEILPSFNSFVLSNLTFMKFILNTLKFAVGVSMYWGFLSEKLVVPVPPNKDSDQFLLVFISLCSFSNTLSQWRGSEMHMLIHFTEQWTAGSPSLPCWLTNKQA